ncbi:MAG: cytochrome c biogenesis protein ResB [bacterium]
MKKIIKFFSSIKLTIFLLILLALTSIIGTLIAQKQDPRLYLQHYGPKIFKLFQTFNLFDVYHSWWFILILILLSLNLLICSLRRFPRDWHRAVHPVIKLSENTAKQYKLCKDKIFNAHLQDIEQVVIQTIKRFGFHTITNSEEAENKTKIIFSQKNRYNFLFFYLTHISIILIFIGGIIGAIQGEKGFIQLPEGEMRSAYQTFYSNTIGNLGFTIRCDDFHIEYYPNSRQPKDYRSKLTIIENNQEILTKIIEVNKPLSYKGYKFYQSSYGQDMQSGNLYIEVQPKDPEKQEPVQKFVVSPGGTFQFKGSDGIQRSVRVAQFLPDFGMNQNRQKISKSDRLNNPAINIIVTPENQPPYSLWSFQNYPGVHMSKTGDYIFTLKGYQGKEYTGLQVAKDPGVPVVWAGCIILIIGILFLLYTAHARIWVRLEQKNSGTRILLNGHSNKNKFHFERQFSAIWENISNSII